MEHHPPEFKGAADPGVAPQPLRTWIRAAGASRPRGRAEIPAEPSTLLEAENAALRKKIRELEEKSENLRKAAKCSAGGDALVKRFRFVADQSAPLRREAAVHPPWHRPLELLPPAQAFRPRARQPDRVRTTLEGVRQPESGGSLNQAAWFADARIAGRSPVRSVLMRRRHSYDHRHRACSRSPASQTRRYSTGRPRRTPRIANTQCPWGAGSPTPGSGRLDDGRP